MKVFTKKTWEPIASNRNWGSDKISDSEIKDLLAQIVKYADDMHKFYFDHVGSKRSLSILIRFLSILLFGYSFFLTLKLSFTPDSEELKIITHNVGSIALASLLLLADRVFTLSANWMTYTQARFEIEKIVADYHSQFIALTLTLDTEENRLQNSIAKIKVLSDFDKMLRMVIINETSAWKTNLTAELIAFSSKIDSELINKRKDLDTSQKEFKKENIDNANKSAEASKTGILIVTFGYSDIEDGTLEINNKDFVIKPNQISITVPGLQQGDYILKGNIKLKKKPDTDSQSIITIDTAVSIKGGINMYNIPKGSS